MLCHVICTANLSNPTRQAEHAHPDSRVLESELRNTNGTHCPSQSAIVGHHVTSNSLALGKSVNIVRVRRIQGNASVDPC